MKESIKLHKKLNGKVYIAVKEKPTFESLRLTYTPGVADACLEVQSNPKSAYELTWKNNSIAVISDGSRVLGLGNIGPLASLPLLEGKAMIFKEYGNVDAVPLPIAQQSVKETVDLIKNISYGFGAINLEDISIPKCFDILDDLIEQLDIPVWHDDQQGTATIIVAGIFNALELVGKKLESIKVVLFGSGAANSSVYRLLRLAGVNAKQISVYNSGGNLGMHRTEMLGVKVFKMMCEETNPEGKKIDIADAFKGADVLVSLSKSGPDVVKPEWIKSMAKDAIVFACANPVPEILPEVAKAAGARIVATGRSDYPNQANNALIFPGLFRGVLDAGLKKITWDMCLDVARVVAGIAKKNGLSDNYIVPRIDEPSLHTTIAEFVAKKFKEKKDK